MKVRVAVRVSMAVRIEVGWCLGLRTTFGLGVGIWFLFNASVDVRVRVRVRVVDRDRLGLGNASYGIGLLYLLGCWWNESERGRDGKLAGRGYCCR